MTGIVALYIFMLAAFTGYEVIARVPVILHTPLMSGSNAIHGIVLVGALTIMGEAHGAAQLVLGFLAVFLATLNVVGAVGAQTAATWLAPSSSVLVKVYSCLFGTRDDLAH